MHVIDQATSQHTSWVIQYCSWRQQDLNTHYSMLIAYLGQDLKQMVVSRDHKHCKARTSVLVHLVPSPQIVTPLFPTNYDSRPYFQLITVKVLMGHHGSNISNDCKSKKVPSQLLADAQWWAYLSSPQFQNITAATSSHSPTHDRDHARHDLITAGRAWLNFVSLLTVKRDICDSWIWSRITGPQMPLLPSSPSSAEIWKSS